MQSLVHRIDEVLLRCRNGVASSKELPFLRLLNQFDFSTFRYEVVGVVEMRFDINMIVSCTRYHRRQYRLVALLLIIRSNMLENTKVTKRALYYQLLKYYKGDYRQVSQDIKTLTYTIGAKRQELGVIASSRGMVCGNIQLSIEGILRQVDNSTYFHLPSEVKFAVVALSSPIVLVVEKESVFNFLAPQFRDTPQVMLVTSKGYPDYNTQAFLKNILVHANGIYYLGDLDPYGFDIMLEYAVGDSFEQFGVPELQWLDIEQLVTMDLVNEESLVKEYAGFSKEDRQKITTVLSREYFKRQLFDEHLQARGTAETTTVQLFGKFQRWAQKMDRYRQLDCKIELESMFKCLLVPAGEAIRSLLFQQKVV